MLGRRSSPRLRAGLLATAAAALAATGLAVIPAEAGPAGGAAFSAGEEQQMSHAQRQAEEREAAGDHEAARGLRALSEVPHAEWLTSGTPEEVRRRAEEITEAARTAGRTPVLVAYNLPLRDCSGYSSDATTQPAQYTAWIEGLAAGIGDRDAVVVLEPDSLGLIPWYTDVHGDLGPCRPAGVDRATAAEQRFELLDHAVTALKAGPGTRVYLDGTHSGWLGVGDAADRLVKAGVRRADGFALNVSNYERTEHQVRYGTWVSQCIHYATVISPGDYAACASQFHPADPGDVSTWSRTDEWYARHVDGAAKAPAGPEELAHFVVDTSRNGTGPWTPDRDYPDAQRWCNPPGRGLGPLPTTDTGSPLADAFLWIKVPGESDGPCDRGLGGPVDPAWGVASPPAGAWFPEQALDLLRNAHPGFRP